jgi:malate dehydrogenase (oxaloacetate-decarboxylating)(NADP+)
VVVDNLEETMPIIYTPTVGQACQLWSRLFRRPRGLYISLKDRGRIVKILRNWPHPVRVIVVTDGERILGLGDQGVGGMGIPVGKLSLYTACAGIHPRQCLPVMLDVGTDREEYLRDPLYMGLYQKRLRGPEYDEFVAEFVTAVQEVMPKAIVQFEDFGNSNAFRLLEIWRDKVCTFNDDIQGTAAVTLSGLLSALRITKKPLREQTILFLGAGEAGIGIGDLISSAMMKEGMDIDEARQRCWFFDTQGLVVSSRTSLAHHKLRYAHNFPPATDFLAAVRALEPTAIIGVSATPKAFNQEVVELMASLHENPIIFALSNPTSKSECTAEEAYEWTRGKAIFASGSPYPPVTYAGKTYVPGQGNNAYIFPGVGLGIVASEAQRVTDAMFHAAARELAACVLESDLDMGRIYPSLTRIREVSARIGTAVAEVAFQEGLTRIPRPASVGELVKSTMWDPHYETYA